MIATIEAYKSTGMVCIDLKPESTAEVALLVAIQDRGKQVRTWLSTGHLRFFFAEN
jgi:hypothetical protein